MRYGAWSFCVLNDIEMHEALSRPMWWGILCDRKGNRTQQDTGNASQAAIHQEPSDRRGEEGCTKGTELPWTDHETIRNLSKPVEHCRTPKSSNLQTDLRGIRNIRRRPRRLTMLQCRETRWVTPSRTPVIVAASRCHKRCFILFIFIHLISCSERHKRLTRSSARRNGKIWQNQEQSAVG